MSRIPIGELPEEIRSYLWEEELKGLAAIDIGTETGDYSSALTIFKGVIDFIKSKEEVNKPIHKAPYLYEIGKIYLISQETQSSLDYLLQSYVDDVLLELGAAGDPAEFGAAFNTLFRHFRIRIEALNEIRETCKQEDSKKDAIDVLNSLDYKSKIADWFRSVKDWPYKNKFSGLGFPEQWEQRVFIGGSYSKMNMNVLFRIQNIVRQAGPYPFYYTPIIAKQHYMTTKEEEIRHRTMLLLHTCKFAIFELSEPAGQLMEIERSRDYESKVLVLYTGNREPSKMVKSYAIISKYEQNELEGLVRAFLANKL